MNFLFRVLIISLFVCASSHVSHAQENLKLYTYHIAPPFIIDADKGLGLTYDLANYLESKIDKKFNFEVVPLPRLRLNREIGFDQNCIVPWVNPAWFNDKDKTHYLWSDGFMRDTNAVISLEQNPIEYSGPASLMGYSLAGLRGGRWVGLEQLTEKKMIEKVEVSNYEGAFKLIVNGRVDGAIVPASVAKYYVQDFENIHFSKHSHSSYQRHFLVCSRKDVHSIIENVANQMHNDPAWAGVLAKYNLDP